MTQFKKFYRPESTLRQFIISQNTFCEEVLVFDKEDGIDNILNVGVGYYKNILYLPFILENCFVSIHRIKNLR